MSPQYLRIRIVIRKYLGIKKIIHHTKYYGKIVRLCVRQVVIEFS